MISNQWEMKWEESYIIVRCELEKFFEKIIERCEKVESKVLELEEAVDALR
jgi:hypothetical protein